MKKLTAALLASIALQSFTFAAYADDDSFIFRYKAGLVLPAADDGGPGDGDDEEEPDDSGAGDGDDEEGPGDGGPGDGGAQQYSVSWEISSHTHAKHAIPTLVGEVYQDPWVLHAVDITDTLPQSTGFSPGETMSFCTTIIPGNDDDGAVAADRGVASLDPATIGTISGQAFVYNWPGVVGFSIGAQTAYPEEGPIHFDTTTPCLVLHMDERGDMPTVGAGPIVVHFDIYNYTIPSPDRENQCHETSQTGVPLDSCLYPSGSTHLTFLGNISEVD